MDVNLSNPTSSHERGLKEELIAFDISKPAILAYTEWSETNLLQTLSSIKPTFSLVQEKCNHALGTAALIEDPAIQQVLRNKRSLMDNLTVGITTNLDHLELGEVSDSAVLQQEVLNVIWWLYDLHDLSLELAYYREADSADMVYREKLEQQFPVFLARFSDKYRQVFAHGTPSWRVDRAIQSGSVSEMRPTEVGANYISVFRPLGAHIPVLEYARPKMQFVPLGCLFLFSPDQQDQEDVQLNHGIREVGLQSERLFRILCSREMLTEVENQLEKKGLSPSLATELEAFMQEFPV